MTPISDRLDDPAYLRAVQYRDASNLDARARLHRRYGRGDWMEWVAARLPWRDGLRVLELGCGPGWLWEAAGRRAPGAALDLTLTDLSPGMADQAIGRAGVAGATAGWTVRGQVADAAALPFADQSFDVVVACHMLYHLPDPAAGVAEIARVLAPGGTALVATNGEGTMGELTALEAEVWPDHPADGVSTRFSLQGGEPVLRAAFPQVTLERYDDDLLVTDPADVVAYIASSPPGAGAGPDALERLWAATRAAFAAGGGTMRIGKDAGLFLCRRDGGGARP
ncbi:MAG TPA: class I SAM-dependent methyltransferase [Phenylobacterium sp.]|nr:class I SAM-dependent methyltransferase [Phenylobacterium sp.]